jgi:hypothetical protein
MPQKELLSYGEAVKIFVEAELSENTFRKRIKAGLIHPTDLPEGRKRGSLYPRDEVLAAAIKKRGKSYENSKKSNASSSGIDLKPTSFAVATLADMPAIADLLESLFDARPNIERWLAWINRNPDIAYVLRSEDQIVGCGFVLPLTEQKILSILAQEVTPVTNPEEIFFYQPEVPVYLYVRSIGVLQKDVSFKQRAHWAEQLILGLTKAVISLGARGIRIEKIYGRSDTKAGERTMRLMGFTQIPTLTSHKNFCIDIATSGLEVVLRYKHALDQWRRKYEGA